jgi:DNA processing protein
MPALSETERVAWLKLARTPTIGPVAFAGLLARFGSAAAAIEAAPRLTRRAGGALSIPAAADIHRELDALEKLGGRMLLSCDAEYPHGLAVLEAPPPILAVIGHPHILRRETVAIVGARNASALGRKLTQILAADLGKAGLVVASGLARGIDAAAHEASLQSGTCAVVAGGVDIVYPPENAVLYDKIKAQGVIVSEMPLGQPPKAQHFPRRNRIISGLSRGVIVIEAAEGSGSLITANFALEQNREVFAVPGSPLDPRAKGTNRLLRQGAILTESADDILAVLAPMIGGDFGEPPRTTDPPPADEISDADAAKLTATIEEALGPAPVAVDELIRLTDVPPGVVLSILLELECAGKITRHYGNKISWS